MERYKGDFFKNLKYNTLAYPFLSHSVRPNIVLSIAHCAILSKFSLCFFSFQVSHPYVHSHGWYDIRLQKIRIFGTFPSKFHSLMYLLV